jgi:hypothetical protein
MRAAKFHGAAVFGAPAPLIRAQSAVRPARWQRVLATGENTAEIGEIGGETGAGLDWIMEAGKALEQEAAMEAAEALRMEQLEEAAGLKGKKSSDGGGVHLQGTTLRNETLFTDENDKRRATWHRKLHLCAEQGDFAGAEEVKRGQGGQSRSRQLSCQSNAHIFCSFFLAGHLLHA